MKFWEYSCAYILLVVFRKECHCKRRLVVATGEKINLALNKVTSQSSTNALMNGWAYKAVDGDTNRNYGHGSCTLTIYPGGWWQVDLGATHKIKEVILYSRKGFEHRLSNFKVLGGVDCNENGKTTCYSECYHQQAEETVHYLIISNCIASYILIRNLLETTFSLCEVQIYGESGQELSTPSIPEALSQEPIVTTTKSDKFVSPWLKTPSVFTTLTTVSTTLTTTVTTTSTTLTTVSKALKTTVGTTVSTILKTTVGSADIQEGTTHISAEVASPTGAIFLNESTLCECFCHAVYQGGKTTEFIEQTKDDIIKNLIVAAEKLSSTIRKKTSAKDERPSAVYTGYVGIIVIVISLGTLILSDLISVTKFVYYHMKIL